MMKRNFETKRFYIYAEKKNMDGVEYFRYFVCNLNQKAHIAVFEATESLEYDNSNILCSNVAEEIFDEVFSAYQKFLRMPVFFWDADKTLNNKCRAKLLKMGAQFSKDVDHETRWFDEENCCVYKLGEHEK